MEKEEKLAVDELMKFRKKGASSCVECGAKAKEKRIELDFCKTCAINFDGRVRMLNEVSNIEALDKYFSKVVNTINSKESYDNEAKEKVIQYFNEIYNERKSKFLEYEESKKKEGVLYDVKGNRGRSLEVYANKIVIKTAVTVGSIISGNMTDGKKTIYYKDVIGLQYKPCTTTVGFIGYLQLETASPMMNNDKSNFFNENTFTFDNTTVSNELMEEIEHYIDEQLNKIKSPLISSADEIRKFKGLLDDQIITQEEFDEKKKKLLNL